MSWLEGVGAAWLALGLLVILAGLWLTRDEPAGERAREERQRFEREIDGYTRQPRRPCEQSRLREARHR